MKLIWKRSISTILLTVASVYLVLAITVFNKPEEEQVCNKVDLNISDKTDEGFLSAKEIKKILERNSIYPLSKPMRYVDTRKIENVLKKSPFVKTAQCYKTPEGHICIELTQRMPVIKIKSNNGDDYYIDDQGGIMPNVRYTSDLVLATGYITKKYAQQHLSRIGKYLMYDSFWNETIEQIDILKDGSVEIVPRIGDHIVYLGRPLFIQKKLERLKKFYKYGLNQVGWNKYSYISLEFDNQIICKKKQNI